MSAKPKPGSQLCSNDALKPSPSLLSFYEKQLRDRARLHEDLSGKLDVLFSSGEYLHRVQWNTGTLGTSEQELIVALAQVNQAMQEVSGWSLNHEDCFLCLEVLVLLNNGRQVTNLVCIECMS
jgi:hypothetical protein